MPYTDPNDQPQPIANDANVTDTQTQPTPAMDAPDAATQPTQQDKTQQPQPGMVSNAAVPSQGQQIADTINSSPPTTHPAVQRASLLHTIAETLAGGPRFATAINPDGTRTVTKVPLSKGDIGMAIALEAIGGALSGYGVKNGPGNLGRAAAAGFDNAAQQRQQADQVQQQQAQQDANNQAQALARRATVFETNMRGMLNAAEVEKYGADAIDKLVQLNREAGLLDPSAEYVENGGVPMTQQELTDAMAKGTIAPTDHLGPIAGRVEVTNPDGSKRWETTHLILKSGDERVPLTQDDWNQYAAYGVKGFPAGTRIGDGQTIKLSIKANANEQLAAHLLSEYRLNALRDVLDGTREAAKVPSKVDWSIPGNDRTMQIYQKYISHDAENSSDPFLALKAMGADKRSPDGTMKPNPDAKYVNTVADAFGGWPVLEAAHNQLLANKQNAEKYAIVDTQDKAEAILAAPKRFSPDQVSAAQNFVRLSQQLGVGKAVSEVRARAVAAGITKRIGWHSFRRTLATLLQSSGASIKTTQELMRHASPGITLSIYAKAVTADKRQAQDSIAALFVGEPKQRADTPGVATA